MDVYSCFTFLLIILTLVIALNGKFRNKNFPPEAAGGWPLIGHLRLLSGPNPPHETLSSMADKYGSIFSIRLGSRRGVVVSGWEVAKECFTGGNDIVFSQRPETEAVRHMSYGFAMFGFSDSGPYWREMRKIAMLKLLSNDRVSMLANLFLLEVRAGMKSLYRNYTVVDLKPFFKNLTFDFMVRVVSGGCQSGNNWHNTVEEFFKMLNVVTVADVFPFLKCLSSVGGMRRAFKKTAEDLDRVLQAWLDEHKKRKENGNCESEELGLMAEMMDIAPRLSQEFPLYDADTINKAMCQTVFLGGTETISVTLTWALCLLLNNPRTLEAAQQEIDTHVGRTRHLQESDIPNLVYTQAIVKETLRLYPAAPLLVPREASADCTVGGYCIPAGTRLMINAWKLHRDPAVWPDPLVFRPERFLTSHREVNVRGLHFELLPFGCGRRVCPGISFALKFVEVSIASLLQLFEIESLNGVDMSGSCGSTNAKATPLEVLLKPRLDPSMYA